MSANGSSPAGAPFSAGRPVPPSRNPIHPGFTHWRSCTTQRSTAVARQDLTAVLERVALGDEAAFEVLYAATSAKLYGIVMRILGRRDVADEVLQEVYMRVWQQARHFDPASGSPITWLASIARNRALDETRRKPMRSLEEFPDLQEISGWGEAIRNHERDGERVRLLACLDRLEPQRKEIILLAYHYGMTREEIARHVGRPVATVKTWLRRSLAQLKDALDGV